VARRIMMSELQIGQVLSWDLFDASGQIVLRRDDILSDEVRLQALLLAGLYTEQPSIAEGSVLRSLNSIDTRLERLLINLTSTQNARSELISVSQQLIQAVDLNPDIALACILLNQIAGSYAVRHCIETAIVAHLVARAMCKTAEEQQRIAAACLTMNIGMLRQQEQINSSHHILSHEERQVVHHHPEESAALLKHVGVDDNDWVSYVLTHHECNDGSGYPSGKSGNEIPENAKIITQADRYCALISARNYRKSMLPDLALQELFINKPGNLDPKLIDPFIQQLGPWPPGTFVRLKNNEIGVVSKRPNSDQVAQVHALISPRGVPLLPFPVVRDADGPLFQIREALHEDDAAIRFSMKQIWGPQASL
jgi:HD-GYP domain-containing protein (c-di-GMP phosphodiesterase class II)